MFLVMQIRHLYEGHADCMPALHRRLSAPLGASEGGPDGALRRRVPVPYPADDELAGEDRIHVAQVTSGAHVANHRFAWGPQEACCRR